MAGRTRVDPRTARKRALVLESELNRALFTAELRELRAGVLPLADLGGVARRAKRLLPVLAPLAGWWSGARGRQRRREKRPGDRGRLDRVVAVAKVAGPLLVAWWKMGRRCSSAK